MVGKVFGFLTVTKRGPKIGRTKNACWECLCTCGQTVLVKGDRLRRGLRKSCAINGHLWNSANKKGSLTLKYKKEHNSWKSMRGRCKNAKHRNFPNYGGRGIKVDPRWDSFPNFLFDMGPKPSPEHSIDRLNVNGDYTKDNCRWATNDEQQKNRRDTIYVRHKGEKVKLVDLMEELGVTRSVVYGRLQRGWPLSTALATPVRQVKKGPERKLKRVPGKRHRGRTAFADLPIIEQNRILTEKFWAFANKHGVTKENTKLEYPDMRDNEGYVYVSAFMQLVEQGAISKDIARKAFSAYKDVELEKRKAFKDIGDD